MLAMLLKSYNDHGNICLTLHFATGSRIFAPATRVIAFHARQDRLWEYTPVDEAAKQIYAATT